MINLWLFYAIHDHTPFKMKENISEIIHNAFVLKKGKLYGNIKMLSLAYFVSKITDVKQIYTEYDIVTIINFLIVNIYEEFGGIIFSQVIGIPMGTNV